MRLTLGKPGKAAVVLLGRGDIAGRIGAATALGSNDGRERPRKYEIKEAFSNENERNESRHHSSKKPYKSMRTSSQRHSMHPPTWVTAGIPRLGP